MIASYPGNVRGETLMIYNTTTKRTPQNKIYSEHCSKELPF